GLDSLWYYSTPGLAWDALFLTTGQKLELITDQDMYMMIEQGLRGGISMVSRRHAKANNPGMGEGNWIADKLKTYLLYLDAPNLFDKDEYVVHYQNLQYYISQGMVLEHIYETIKFEQSP